MGWAGLNANAEYISHDINNISRNWRSQKFFFFCGLELRFLCFRVFVFVFALVLVFLFILRCFLLYCGGRVRICASGKRDLLDFFFWAWCLAVGARVYAHMARNGGGPSQL